MARKQIKEVVDAANRIRPVLFGRPPEIQGAILAELLSCWLAGHITDTPEYTQALRDELLIEHIEAVRKLISVNEKAILAAVRKRGRMQ